ncbi:MAG: dienelactone hydrolase family protein [Cyanobium sp.]
MSTEFASAFRSTEKVFPSGSHPVWTGGEGPSVILMHELDGFSPAFIELALRLSQSFTIHAPVFFGEVGQFVHPVSALFCMRREFELFRLGHTSAVAHWVRDLVEDLHQHSHGQPLAIIGMCMTGGIVLATISLGSVAAAVAAQPSLPFAISQRGRQDLGLTASDLQAAASATTPVLTLRYGRDVICPAERITSLLETVPTAIRPPDFLADIRSHATLTDRYRTNKSLDVQRVSDQAIDHVVGFLRQHLPRQA